MGYISFLSKCLCRYLVTSASNDINYATSNIPEIEDEEYDDIKSSFRYKCKNG